MVWAESVTLTLVYTYNAQGLRVAQSVNGVETPFVWDWASGIPEMLSDGTNLYLVEHEILGQWDGATWAYYLPDALGSIRQTTDAAGSVTSAREWTPFGGAIDTLVCTYAGVRAATSGLGSGMLIGVVGLESFRLGDGE